MNHTQKKYAMERVSDIAKDKINAIRQAMPVIKPLTITYRKALQFIKAGKVKMTVDLGREFYYYKNIGDAFDFSKYHEQGGSSTYDEKKFNKKANVIRKERTRIKDQIMLGDAEEALKLIEEFAKL